VTQVCAWPDQTHIRIMILRPFLLVVLLCLSACMTPTTDVQRLPAGAWQLDPSHSSVIWRVRHTGLTWYTGRFDEISARLDFDPARPDAAQLTAIIAADSISTGDAAFDTVLSESWLHADRHPQLVFRSQRIERIDDTHGRAHGELSLNGRTHPAALDIEFHGGGYNMLVGTDVIGFAADLTIDRGLYGVGNLPASIVGDEIRVHIEVEFLRQGDGDD
jgi:polyisoprenoid-binding protein YceI